ncbi:MAG: adenine deaminase [Coriobacteriales bacterium]|jgi:adenine deaminase|nr:adenine deaminase [Coriobacteriales bacterium]
MINKFNKSPHSEVTLDLVAVAQGQKPADTVITNARLINVITAEILDDISVAITCGRIAYVGPDATHCIGDQTLVIDANGQYIAPGFMDGHIHVESSMLSVSQYARVVVPHGTTALFWDPHEICNVLGFDGVKLMAEDATRTPLKAMIVMPSCVPAVPGFEDTGSAILAADVAQAMQLDNIVGLGEMMNFPGILFSEPNAHQEVAETLKAGKIVTGHYSIPENDQGLNAYISAGVRCCHESTRYEDGLAKMRLGMYAQFREGSAWHDLHELAKIITDRTGERFDTRLACLISDDTHPNTLASLGHLDHIVRRAIEEGIDPVTAIQMVTINTAQCFQLDHELGSIAPGKCADIVFISDLEQCTITRTIIDGEIVAESGVPLFELSPFEYPEWATGSMHIQQAITNDSFKIPAPAGAGDTVKTRVIEVIPLKVGTFERFVELPVVDGLVESDISQDVLKTFVFERHHNTGLFAYGFTKGFGIANGAMASTVAHDAHNLLVLGTNDDDMTLAANTLIDSGGGSVVVQNGKVVGHVPLPVAGLMNASPLEDVVAMVAAEEEAWEAIGCTMASPFMTMALIPLACLPELRLTNRGLVDCRTFEFVDLFC